MKGFSLVFFLCLSHSWTVVLSQSNLPSKFVNVSGKKMAYKAFGLENRKPGQAIILFESGLGAGGDSYEPLFTSLEKAASGIAYDRNGIGRSEIDSSCWFGVH
ncbi:alpha/beta fold hydrolase [Dyadobacter arcticus]|uniref:Pimeloyl-ACP methyl ester carboxylesterase n=1 Tax=Dyadobacter arcticus TaxID=1078754 RepID=A0ABX0USP2_9BACT|nr:hypothetical protein [Dyadobacter arcticus]NIJ54680.1 pimeloyl-ACP methyl ester carboxylesterase [Dyadobacter arcticus]